MHIKKTDSLIEVPTEWKQGRDQILSQQRPNPLNMAVYIRYSEHTLHA